MGDSMDTSAFRRGLKIEIDGDPWEIVASAT
jgi:translation elongation factor P/translation initiation factor 5A